MAGPFVVSRNGAVIGAPPQQVFEYLADMTRHGEWNPDDGFRVTAQPEGRPGLGSVFSREKNGVMRGPLIIRGGMSDNPVRVVRVMTITAYQPHAELAFETRNSFNGLLHSVETMSFNFFEEPEGTRVTMVAQIEPMLPSAYIGPVYAIRIARVAFDRLLGKRLSSLFPSTTVGPQLSRVKEMMETGKITRRL